MKRNTGTEGKPITPDRESIQSQSTGITRRRAVKLAAVSLAIAGAGSMNTSFANDLSSEYDLGKEDGKGAQGKEEENNPIKKVQYEEMLPDELEIVLREYPVAYVPFGSLEWHGKHLPYGNDALKAHGILVRTAQKYGGAVVPPTYWGHMGHWQIGNHPGLSYDLTDRLFIEIFEGLVVAGFRVIIGVTGHDVKPQVDSLQKAVNSISDYLISPLGRTVGFAMMEGSLNLDDPDVGMDHAAKWETSILMALRPELVDIKRLAGVDKDEIESGRGMDINGCGISGKDPRIYASKEVGEKAIEKIVDKIGQKANELLVNINWQNNDVK
jgi:creatinine amidohydrolase